ncbi:hypothetical protein IH824_20405 [candidate division KSB1 bacterium]|nr:hypothetical protein [candidate division KSB1 bacterium]
MLKSTKIIASLLLVFLFLPSGIQSQSANLPLDHWAYAFLERLELKGLYISEDFDTKPYSREAIAEIILQIDEKVKQDSSKISAVEWDLLEQLKGEFHEDLKKLQPEVEIRNKEYEPHLWSWRNEDFVGHLDLLLGQQVRLESKESVESGIAESTTSWGFGLRANFKESMAMFFEGRSFVLSGTDTIENRFFNPSLGLPVTRNALGDVTDNASAYAVFRLPWFDLEIGRDLVEWGPGFRGNLILSRNSNFYDLFKATFRYERLKFVHFHGFLNAERTKYLAGHRIEVRPSDSFRFSINETVVYGGRGVEFLYANPFFAIIIAERHLGNKDNNLVSLDFTWFLRNPELKLYGEFLFDDFNPRKNLFHDFVNKWGVLIGGYWVDPFGLSNTDFRLEYVRIQPFVYWHTKGEINFYTNYSNFMGHWLGPDSDDFYVEIKKRVHKNFRFGLSFERRRRGQNDLSQLERPPDQKFNFLGGVVEKNSFYGATFEWQLLRDIFLNATYQFIQTDNLRRVAGQDQNNHRLLVNLSLNY